MQRSKNKNKNNHGKDQVVVPNIGMGQSDSTLSFSCQLMLVEDLRRNTVEFFMRKAGQSVQMRHLVKSLFNAMFRERPFDKDMAAGSKATEDFRWRCRKRGQNL